MLLVIAMVLSAALVKAYEQGKVRTKTRWDEARRRAEERGAQRERERQERAAAWSAWFDRGVSSGPRHPLWWVYAAGWTTGGAMAALGAGAVGVYSGAVVGGKSGYTLGATAGKQGRKYREAFREWRKANRGKGDPVELGICGRCEGWIAKSELSASKEYGQVCPDCFPAPERDSGQDPDPRFESSTVHDRNYADEPRGPRCRCGAGAAPGKELCWSCLWREADYWDRVAEEAAKRRRSNGAGRTAPRDEFIPRCFCGAPVPSGPGPVECPSCRERRRQRRRAWKQAETEEQEQEGPVRATAERVYPEQEEETQPKEITNTMAENMPAKSSDIAATGEGLGDTLRTLNALASLLNKAHEEMTSLGDSLTANSLDAETLSRINELNDLLDTAAPMAKELHRHVENRHNPVADAMAAAGGSGNVATKTFYDDH